MYPDAPVISTFCMGVIVPFVGTSVYRQLSSDGQYRSSSFVLSLSKGGSPIDHSYVDRTLGVDADPQALVDAALGLVTDDVDPAHLTGVGDVCAAVGLKIETFYIYDAHLCDLRRQ